MKNFKYYEQKIKKLNPIKEYPMGDIYKIADQFVFSCKNDTKDEIRTVYIGYLQEFVNKEGPNLVSLAVSKKNIFILHNDEGSCVFHRFPHDPLFCIHGKKTDEDQINLLKYKKYLKNDLKQKIHKI